MNEQTISIESIPHRPPFLFVDSVEELGDDRIVTKKYVDPNLECFQGHYPGNPVMPGVLICECCFQAGALLMAHRRGGYDPSEGVPVLTRVQDARFRRIVRPGETLRIEVTVEDTVDAAFYMQGEASVEGELSVRVKFACMLARDRREVR